MTIDALRADRISARGYRRSTTPKIDELLKCGWSPPVTYTLSSSTGSAFPAIMTSSRPLSYGGFDSDILSRPPTLSSVLSAAGYRTAHISPTPWVSSVFGYNASRETPLYSPGSLEKATGRLFHEALTRYARGELSFAAADAASCAQIESFFAALGANCAAALRDRGGVQLEIRSQRYRWNAVAAAIEREEARWRADRPTYLRDAGAALDAGRGWLTSINWASLRTVSDILELGSTRIAAMALQPLLPRQGSRLRWRRKPYPDAMQMVDEVLNAVEAARHEPQPFFIWAHLLDAHIPYTFGGGKSWMADAPRWLSQTGHDPTIDPLTGFRPEPRDEEALRPWIACYDAAVAFIDAQVGRLWRELQARGAGDTILVIASDHGEELGEHGDTSHRFRLYEHNTRIHMSVHHPDLSQLDVAGFCTSLDIAPTIANLVAIEGPSSWEGLPLERLYRSPRTRVLLETFYGSPCDPTRRPLYFAARSDNLKLMWCEAADPRDRLAWSGLRLFDLTNDPDEQHSIAHLRTDVVSALQAPMLARKAELLAGYQTESRGSA